MSADNKVYNLMEGLSGLADEMKRYAKDLHDMADEAKELRKLLKRHTSILNAYVERFGEQDFEDFILYDDARFKIEFLGDYRVKVTQKTSRGK